MRKTKEFMQKIPKKNTVYSYALHFAITVFFRKLNVWNRKWAQAQSGRACAMAEPILLRSAVGSRAAFATFEAAFFWSSVLDARRWRKPSHARLTFARFVRMSHDVTLNLVNHFPVFLWAINSFNLIELASVSTPTLSV